MDPDATSMEVDMEISWKLSGTIIHAIDANCMSFIEINHYLVTLQHNDEITEGVEGMDPDAASMERDMEISWNLCCSIIHTSKVNH